MSIWLKYGPLTLQPPDPSQALNNVTHGYYQHSKDKIGSTGQLFFLICL
jgi:hypothetical protein